MRIISSTIGNHISDPFKKTAICANAYIPIYASHFLTFLDDNVKFYTRPTFDTGCLRKANTLKNVKAALEMYISPAKIPIGSKSYFFIKGAMYTEEGIPMMVLAMPRKDYEDPNIRKFSDLRYGQEVNPVDYKNFVLFYSTSFFTDPSLAALNRRFQKEILIDCYTKGIEVRVITSSEIEKNTFADLFEIPKANSVSQLEEYMSTVLPNYLYTEEEDTFVFGNLEVVQTQEEELSLEEEALLFDSQQVEEVEQVEEVPDLVMPSEEELIELRELETEAATWDSAHTEYPMTLDQAFSTSTSFPSTATGPTYFIEQVDSPLGYSGGELTTSVGDVVWRQIVRDERPIELIDDEV